MMLGKSAACILGMACGLLGAAPTAHGADPKVVAYFEETCGACHGPKGLGMAGLAPPLKGSPFVLQASTAEIESVITKGRAGEQKKFPTLASPMPPHSMSQTRLKGVIAYLREELQQ
jgi:mono/diheme cytochrome c family protein